MSLSRGGDLLLTKAADHTLWDAPVLAVIQAICHQRALWYLGTDHVPFVMFSSDLNDLILIFENLISVWSQRRGVFLSADVVQSLHIICCRDVNISWAVFNNISS